MFDSQTAKSATRNLLDKTLKTVESLTETMEDLITEEKATKLLLEEINLRVKEIERKYGDLKDHIVQTRQSKEKMEAIAQNLRCLLSPMQHLPTEILIKIFRMTIDEVDASRRLLLQYGEVSPPDRVPLVFSQVCSRWRTILSNNSSLWSLLEFGNRRDDGTLQTRAETRRLRRFARSGSPGGQDIILSHWNLLGHAFLLKTLPAKTVKYRSLEIHMHEDPLGQWDTRTLIAREVTIYRSVSVPSIEFVVPLLRLASKIAIHGSPQRWAGLPWMALTELLIRPFNEGYVSLFMTRCFVMYIIGDLVRSTGYPLDIQRADFCNLLDAAPSLKKLRLDFQIEEGNIDGNEPMNRTHLTLQYLEVHLQHLSSQQGLLGVHLDLPYLSTLHILSFDSHPSGIEEPIFTSWSPSRLVFPNLHNHEVIPAAKLLSQLPNIKRLELSGTNSDIIIKYVDAGYVQSRTSSITPFKSKLTTLHLMGTDIRGDTLLGLVQERLRGKREDRAGAYALEHISMYDTPGVSPADWWAIQALLEEGRTENATEL